MREINTVAIVSFLCTLDPQAVPFRTTTIHFEYRTIAIQYRPKLKEHFVFYLHFFV